MKKGMRCAAVLLSGVAMLAATACTPEAPDTEDTLEIYVQDLGFGTQWLRDEIELFKEQDWVKEKYPNLNIPAPKYNSQYGYGTNLIKAGAQANSIDLFFISADYEFQSLLDSSGNHYVADLNDVFNSQVPGEEIDYKDKMFDEYERMSRYNNTYWSTLWSAPYSGLLYNADRFEELGLEVPVTTNDLLGLCKEVKETKHYTVGQEEKDYTIMFSTQRTEAMYWQYLAFPAWWMQYEGLDHYYDFYRGIDYRTGTRDSRDIYRQPGRKAALDVLYPLIHDYSFSGAGSIDFIEAQTRFLMGDGLIMANGDWFYNEMRQTVDGLKPQGYDYDIRFMKIPVISSVVDNLDTVKEEGQLKAVIQAIDSGASSVDELSAELDYVSKEDFEHLYEVRTTIPSNSMHQAFIPAYATATDLAKDFLRFLATDIAINQYMKSTRGAAVPFDYNVTEKDPELYATFDGIQQYRHDIFYATAEGPKFVLSERDEEFPLFYLGGMKAVPSNYIDSAFTVGGGMNAEQFNNEMIEYYAGSRWDDVLRNAGRK